MSHPSKIKGNACEREFVELARGFGLKAKRAWGSDGRSIGKDPEVDITIKGTGEQADFDLQIKRRKKIASYLQVPESCDAVGFRQDRGRPMILLDAVLFFELLQRVDFAVGQMNK